MAAKSWVQRLHRFLSLAYPWLPGTFATFLSVGIWQMGHWERLERFGYKTLFQIRETGIFPRPEWDQRVVAIGIDEASLKAYGQFPWSRDRYVQLLQALQKSNPAAIGFDIMFVDPSSRDAALAQAIATNRRVVLARAWDKRGEFIEPVPELAAGAANQGHIWHQVDPDGMTRQAALWINGGEFSIPSLGVALIEVYNLYNPQNKISLPQPIQDTEIQNVWINWPRKVNSDPRNPQLKSPPTYSFVDVVNGQFDPSAFAGKFVLVGFTATALGDQLRSPLNLNPPTSGIYFHAALIDNLLNDRLLQRLPHSSTWVLLLGFGLLTNWLLLKRSLKERLIVSLTLPVVWMGIAAIAFSFYGWWLPVAAPLGTFLLVGVSVQLREQYEKQQLMDLFKKHVAPETANLIWQRKDEIIHDGELEAQEMVATVLFMDIRSFTSISEKLKPRELLGWLNQYLDVMSDCIMDHGGVIDKYIGDAIMAVFGIPFAQSEPEAIQQDALNAIAASFAMHERLQQLNQQLKADGKPLIQFGIGIHTGTVIAGSVGGSRRLSYSVLGDTVNIAARLEAMNKELTANKPYKILLTSETFEYVRDRYRGEPLKSIQLRGRQQETMIYTLLGQ